jgi:2-polyprenyl-3-methyl-5-hydroxy-6-metoxy-1,4-benzoquinol methylase
MVVRCIGLLDGEKPSKLIYDQYMLTNKQKIKYFIDSVLATGQEVKCTFCGSTNCLEIDRKYIVTKLLECQNCHLYFRYPVDKKEFNAEFYQTEYQEKDKMTTDLPDAATLEKIKNSSFNSANKNANRFLDLFDKLLPARKPLKIVDYGCSWGYQTYQFLQAGHQVQGYEISRSRASFGSKNLGIEILTNEDQLKGGNDIFFSSHVIEHHPDIPSMIALAKSLLKQGGYFIAVAPNGSTEYRKINPNAFHHIWGKVHPNYLNADFYKFIFKDCPYYIGSSPFVMKNIYPLEDSQFIDNLTGEELLVIVKF